MGNILGSNSFQVAFRQLGYGPTTSRVLVNAADTIKMRLTVVITETPVTFGRTEAEHDSFSRFCLCQIF